MLTVEIPSLISPDSTATEEHRSDVAHCKRFCEYWAAHPEFREALPKDPYGVAQAAGLKTDPLSIRRLWELDPEHPAYQAEPSLTLLRYRSFMAEKLAFRDTMQTQVKSPHRGYRAWRERQIRRCYGELGKAKGEGLVHAGLAVELCEGCSVGCWFCGISALKFNGVWPYSDENARLWREVLDSLHEQIGDAAGAGFCYWATDPLDNPDYEQFCLDFYDIFGQFPQTTTALALKDVERTRNLLQLSQKHGCPINRFSVLSRKQLLRIHEQFTPLELLRVELVLQNKESLGAKSAAGKALSEIEGEDTHATTIACVSGFLFNMPDRQVRWVSPCPASSEHPDGYITHGQAHFETVDELRSILKQWAAVPARLRLTDVVRWRQDLRSKPTEDGFRLQDHRQGANFDTSWYPAAERLGELVAEGRHTVEEICNHLDEPAEQTILALQRFHQSAFLEEIS